MMKSINNNRGLEKENNKLGSRILLNKTLKNHSKDK